MTDNLDLIAMDAFLNKRLAGGGPPLLDVIAKAIRDGGCTIVGPIIAFPFESAAESLRNGDEPKKVLSRLGHEIGILAGGTQARYSANDINACYEKHLNAPNPLSGQGLITQAMEDTAEELHVSFETVKKARAAYSAGLIEYYELTEESRREAELHAK